MARHSNRRIREFVGDSKITAEFSASACAGKQAFATPQLAHKVAAKRRIASHPYRCRVCGLYHIA